MRGKETETRGEGRRDRRERERQDREWIEREKKEGNEHEREKEGEKRWWPGVAVTVRHRNKCCAAPVDTGTGGKLRFCPVATD